MTKFGKIIILGIVIAVLVVAGFSIWFFNPDRKVKLEIVKTIKNQEVQKEQALKALKEFAGKIDQCQNFGKQALMLDFGVVDMNTTYGNFGIGTPIENLNEDVYGYTPTVEEKVAIFRDNDLWAGKINEYQVNLKTDEVISMRPIDDPNATPYYEITPDEAKKINKQKKSLYTFLVLPPNKSIEEIIREATEDNARRCLREIVTTFDEIDTTYTFTHTVEEIGVGNSDNNPRYTSQRHLLRWQDNNYTPPEGLVSEMPPFVQVAITNSGHILSYQNNLSFFGGVKSDTPTITDEERAELLENCAKDIPREKIDDTALNQFEKIVTVWWWDNEIQDNIALKLPYEPETGFAGCSESVKALLLHIQETYEDR